MCMYMSILIYMPMGRHIHVYPPAHPPLHVVNMQTHLSDSTLV